MLECYLLRIIHNAFSDSPHQRLSRFSDSEKLLPFATNNISSQKVYYNHKKSAEHLLMRNNELRLAILILSILIGIAMIIDVAKDGELSDTWSDLFKLL